MADVLDGLRPQSLWTYFREISDIPRCSGDETQILAYLKKTAENLEFSPRMDDAGNICIPVPATPGFEAAPIAVLQAHMDMVCTQNSGVGHDFSKDPIKFRRDGDWLKAEGTSLGADNGIGIAAALAVASSDAYSHGPLEILVTSSEETGLVGAFNLKPEMVEGRILLNLDSEEIGIICMGCAGGARADSYLTISTETLLDGWTALSLKISGLRGGHSGINIHENRANAIKVLAGMLFGLRREVEFRIADFKGGDRDNAIPREASATIALPSDLIAKTQEVLEKQTAAFKREFPRDPGMTLSIEVSKTRNMLDAGVDAALLGLILAYPSGVISMSQELDDLVETSNTLAIVEITEGRAQFVNAPRSSLAEAMQSTLDRIQAITEMAGGEFVLRGAYPGWQPDPESRILNLLEETHLELFDKKPLRLAFHAGLECGIIGEKLSGMDMASFGPEIVSPHSPDEAVQISTVEPFFNHLTTTLKAIADGKY